MGINITEVTSTSFHKVFQSYGNVSFASKMAALEELKK